jgi:hypothetical protein
MHQLRTSFAALDVADIVKVKPSMRLDQDVLAWAYERHGSYSVKSAYKLLKEDQMAMAMATTGESRSSDGNYFWKKTWNLNIPPKVRVFWWRVLHNRCRQNLN